MISTPSLLLRLCIGHRSEMLDRPTADGHTHRWTVFVRSAGPHQFVDRTFVTKVVFELHPDFANPHRVVKEPPFEVTETGYAGFTIPVNVSFSGTSKTYRLHYDMNLCLEKQSEHKVEQILEMKQPSASFAELITKYGGIVKKDKKKDKHRSKERTTLSEHHRKEKNGLEEPRIREKLEKLEKLEKREKTFLPKEQLEESKSRKDGTGSEERQEKKEKTEKIDKPEKLEKPEKIEKPEENGFHPEQTTSLDLGRNSGNSEGKETDRPSEIGKERERMNGDMEDREKSKRVKTCNEEHIANKKMKVDESAEMESMVALQRKLMTLCDVERLQALVDVIIASGPSAGIQTARMCLNDDNLLSFDLCALNTSLISQFDDICSKKIQS